MRAPSLYSHGETWGRSETESRLPVTSLMLMPMRLAEVKKDIDNLICTVDSLKDKIERISRLLGMTVSRQLNAL
jgi:hypothetical protein